MNFVEWVTAIVLLLTAVSGGYGGLLALARRVAEVPPYTFKGRGAVLLALLYFAGALAALTALVLMVLFRTA